MAAHSEPLALNKRLDTWKEIAAFFGRDERTVKRWEKERGLPVHRVPGSVRGGVFAYSEELADWLSAPNRNVEVTAIAAEDAKAESQKQVSTSEAISDFTSDSKPRENFAIPITESAAGESPIGRPAPASAVHRSAFTVARSLLWITPLALILISFFVFSFSHHELRFTNALAAPHVPGSEAQDLYLKGRYYFEKRTADDLTKAVDLFTQSIVHDPSYAAPYVGLADTYNLLREYSAMPAQEAYPRARAAALKAVELDPSSAEAHNSLAFASYWGFFDAATAEREYKRAIELDPSLSRAHHWYATFLVEIGRSKDALAEIERARQLNPSSTPILADKGFILYQSGKTEEARTLLTQLTASQPDFVHPHRYLADIYFAEGNYAGYFDEEKIALRMRRNPALEKTLDAEEQGYASSGLPGLLDARLHFAQAAFERGNGSAFEVAEAHAALGQNDDAMKYLQIAYQRHDLSLAELPVNQWFKTLHRDQEFRDLLTKIGLPIAD